MNVDEYKQQFTDESAPGWEAIDKPLRDRYGTQEPQHWGTLISYRLGGPDPLDGISAYRSSAGGTDHLHYVTYGYSSLYFDEESVGKEFSGYGFEMTFRLAHSPGDEPPVWVCNLFQNIARYVFDSGKWFEDGHWIPANGPIHAESDTDIVGLAFLTDPELAGIDTPHGRVDFLQAFGLTQSELDALKSKTKTCREIVAEHRTGNPLLVTDLGRRNE